MATEDPSPGVLLGSPAPPITLPQQVSGTWARTLRHRPAIQALVVLALVVLRHLNTSWGLAGAGALLGTLIAMALMARRPTIVTADGFLIGKAKAPIPFIDVRALHMTSGLGVAELIDGSEVPVSFQGLALLERVHLRRWVERQLRADVFA